MQPIPKDEGFFELFDQLDSRLIASARLLDQLFTDPGRLDHCSAQIRLIEREADDLVHEVTNRLDRTFVTPLDREDIHRLASSLDNVIDAMDGTARRVQMFNVTDRREPAKRLAGLLVQASEVIAEAVRNIKKSREVVEATRMVKVLKEEGEGIHSAAVGALFRLSDASPLEVLKWKEIYDHLEHALDECEGVMNVLESIVLKNS